MPLPRQIGSTILLKGENEKDTYLQIIKARVPMNEQIFTKDNFLYSFMKIALPRSGQEYVFSSVDHANLEEYIKLGEKALNSTGFLFLRKSPTPALLVEQSRLTGLISVTDLDDDGIYEMLIQSSSYAVVTYAIWLFDGKKFTGTKRTIYEWMH